jgi:hypothetical protein
MIIFNFRIIITFLLITLSSCQHHLNDKNDYNLDCPDLVNEVNSRKNLFKDLSLQEKKYRMQIRVPTVSKINQLSVFSKIVEAVNNSKPNSKIIPVDLRFYKDVDLGNIIISNLDDNEINNFLKTSKYSQGYFALINFSNKKITILSPKVYKVFSRSVIDRNDLFDSEIVINVSNSKSIFGNMKFSANKKISIIADNIELPYRLDLREASNMQFNLNNKWIMNIYSFENSLLDGGKITTGFFKYLNNKNSYVKIHKFNNSKIKCLFDKKDLSKF